MGIRVDLDKCTGCGNCVLSCPFDLIDIIDQKAHISEGCNLCGACQGACTSDAIIIEADTEAAPVSDSHRGIWVFAEQRDGKLKSVSYELLAVLAETLVVFNPLYILLVNTIIHPSPHPYRFYISF